MKKKWTYLNIEMTAFIEVLGGIGLRDRSSRQELFLEKPSGNFLQI